MPILDSIAAWPGAVWLQNSGTAYLFVNAAHILGIGLLVGSILPLDVTLARGPRAASLTVIGPLLMRTAAVGLTLALATGIWLFSVKPREYVANPAFIAKMALLALALVNIAAQHLSEPFRIALRDGTVVTRVRVFAVLSALLWLSVLLAGRWIGFV